MSDAGLTWGSVPTRSDPPEVTLPAPVPFGPPVLIGDCATPLCGTTLLSLLIRATTRDE